MVTAAPRAAELRPRLLGGRALEAVRGLRVAVTPDGAVVASSAAGTTTLAAPGEVHRVLHVDYAGRRIVPGEAYTGPVIVLVGAGGRPLTAFRVLDWTPPSHPLPREALDVSGARALAAALDLPLEPAEAGDLPAPREVGRLLVRPVPPRPWPGRAAPVLCWLALALVFAALTQAEEPAGAALCAAAVALLAPVVIFGARAKAAARRASADVARASSEPALRPRPDRPVARGLLEASVRTEAGDIVLADRGREVWLPGPQRGGVREVVVDPELVRLADAAGRDYARLERALWAPTTADVEALTRAATAMGLETSVRPLPGEGYPVFAPLASAGTGISHALSEAERGDATLSTPWLSGFAAAIALVVALIAATENPLGWLLVLASGVLLAVRITDSTRQWLADRRAVRPAGPAAVEALR